MEYVSVDNNATEPDVTYKLPCRTAPSGCNAFSVASPNTSPSHA